MAANNKLTCVNGHKVANSEDLVSYTQLDNSVHLVLKPELIQKSIASKDIILVEDGDGIKVNSKVKCKCELQVGKYVPIGPCGACAVAFSLEKTEFFGKRFGKKDKWGKQFDLHNLIEARNFENFYGTNLPESNDKWQKLKDDLKQRLSEMPEISFASLDTCDSNFNSQWYQWTDIINDKIPRDYQLETYRLALVKDVISVLPTGFGKTLTAVLLLSRMAKMNKEHMGLFVVERIPLVYQQAQRIQEETDMIVICINSETINRARLNAIIHRRCDVVVITAGALKEQIERKTLTLQLFHTIVLDECHHVTGNHSYSTIVKTLNTSPVNRKPRLLGLSASPFKVENHIKGRNEMCKFMTNFPGALLFRPKCINSIDMPQIIWHQIQPTHNEEIFSRFIYQELKESCATSNVELDQKWIENDLNVKHYLNQIQGALRNHQHTHCSKEISNNLTYINALEIARVIGVNIAKKLLIENISNKHPTWLSKIFDSSKSDRLLHLEKEIEAMSEDKMNDKSQMLILTSTRECARLLKDILSQLYPSLNPAFIVGKNGSNGMDWEEQKPILSAFNSGSCKLLVATSVLEEGIDVAACDRVILFSGHINLIRFIQSRGRARKSKSRFIVLSDETENKLRTILEDEQMMHRLIDNENNSAFYVETMIKMDKIKWITKNYDESEIVRQVIEERRANVGRYLKIGEMSTVVILDKAHISRIELEENLFKSIENTGLFDIKRMLKETSTTAFLAVNNVVSENSSYYVVTIEDFNEGCRTSMDIFIDFCLNWSFCLIGMNENIYCTIPKITNDTSILNIDDLTFDVSFVKMIDSKDFELLCKLQHKFSINFGDNESVILRADGTEFHSCFTPSSDIADTRYSTLIKVETIGSLGFGFLCVKENSISIYLHLVNAPKFHEEYIDLNADVKKTCRMAPNELERSYIGESDFIELEVRTGRSEMKRIISCFSKYFCNELFVGKFSSLLPRFKNQNHFNFEIEWRLEILKSSRNVMVTNGFKELVYRYYKQECVPQIGHVNELALTEALDFMMTTECFLDSVEDKFYASYRSGKKFSHSKELRNPPDNWTYVKRLVVTPSRFIYFPAVLMKKSRLLRMFSKEEFVIVSFRDEDLSRLNNISLIKPIKDFISEGLELCGEKYHFICASSSQLREGKAYFVRSELPNVCQMRNEILNLNDQYSTSLKNVAKYLSRVGLYSTSDVQLSKIDQGSINKIDDIRAENGSLLTDGAGKIKYSFLKDLGYENATAIQFRLGGSKGILVKALPDDQDFNQYRSIALRPSMIKFTSLDQWLTVVAVNEYMPLTLNREVINLLVSIDKNTEVPNIYPYLESLQDEVIAGLCNRLENVKQAEITIKPLIPKQHFRQVTDFFDVREEPYWRSLLLHSVYIDTKELREKTNIPIKKGCRLMGVPDPCNVLSPHEVFLRVCSPDGLPEVITGNVLIFRNPCLHPGDLRIKKAVLRSELIPWTNVLIFPCSKQSSSSIADECSGGDVDGDVFSIIWDDKIVPSKSSEVKACNYQALSNASPNEIRICEDPNDQEALSEIYELNMVNDTLGRVAHLHMALCDQLDEMALDPLAIELAKSQSVAVDCPKTGIVPQVPKKAMELVKDNGYPDFMGKKDKNVYISENLLGILYRKACSVAFDKEIKEYICKFSFDPLLKVDGYEHYEKEANELFEVYRQKMKVIMRRFNLENEQEAAMGRPLSWHPLLKGNKGKSENAITTSFKHLQNSFRNIFYQDCKSSDEAMKKASAWYQVAYNRCNDTHGYFLSFPWVAAETLCEIKNQKKITNTSCIEVDIGRTMVNLFSQNVPEMIEKIKRNEMIHLKVKELLLAKPGVVNYTEIYGSISMFLFSNESDLDIFVRPQYSELNTEQILDSIVETLSDVASDVKRSKLNALTPLVKCKISDGDDYYCDLTLNEMGRLKTHYMQSLYKRDPAILVLMWNVVQWARHSRIIKSGCIDDCLASLPTAEFYSMILIACGICKQENENSFVLEKKNIEFIRNDNLCKKFSDITQIIMDSSNTDNLARTVGNYFMSFFRKASIFNNNLDIIWKLNEEMQNVSIQALKVRGISSICKKALQVALLTRDIGKVNEIAQNNPSTMEFVKYLPSTLSSIMLSSLTFHQTHLSILSGAKVILEQDQDQSKVILKASGHQKSITKLSQEIRSIIYARQALQCGIPRKKADRYMLDNAAFLMMKNVRRDDWMVGFDNYHGSKQIDHVGRQTSKIICGNHINDQTWNEFAHCLLYERLEMQLSSKPREESSEFFLVARFGVFYAVDASITLNELHQKVTIGELSQLLFKNRMYRKGFRPDYKLRPSSELENQNFQKVKLEKRNESSLSDEKSRKLKTLRRNKKGLAAGYVSTLETDRPLDLKLQFKDILKKRGYWPVQHSLIKPDNNYLWKISILVSTSYELILLLRKDGTLGDIRERDLKWIHCTILDNHRNQKHKFESNIDPRNDIRIVLESSKPLNPSEGLFKFVFPNGVLPTKPILRVVNGVPKIAKDVISENAFKNLFQTRRLIDVELFSNGKVMAGINSGSMHERCDLKQSRIFCDIALYFDTKQIVDVMDGRQQPKTLKNLTKQIIEESMGLSNDIKMHFMN